MSNAENVYPIDSQWLIDVILNYGYTLEDISSVIGIKVTANNTQRLPLHKNNSLLEWLSQILGDRYFGLKLARTIPATVFGGATALGYHSENLEEGILNLVSYSHSISPAIEFELTVSEGIAKLTYFNHLPPELYSIQDHELTAAQCVYSFRLILHENWQPLKVEFSHAEPESLSEYKSIFGDKVFFNAGSSSVYFDESLLKHKVASADPYVQEIIKKQVIELTKSISKDQALPSLVRHFITKCIGTDQCNVVDAALELCMSRRNLTKKLAAYGTSFTSIKGEVTLFLAKQALSSTQTRISDISLNLGYADLSSFDRSFKKLTGLSPRDYRHNKLDES